MNKQSTQKLEMFLLGLQQRITENSSFFKKITLKFKSGTKMYEGTIILQDDRLLFQYNGRNDKMEISWLGARVSKIAQEYEAVSLVYEERGTTIFIDADNKNVKMKTKDTEIAEICRDHNETSQISNRDYYIKIGAANDLLKAIGILSENGKIKNDMIRKYNQIDHYIELVDDILKSLCSGYDSINVVDCGCGKSYLSFVLNYYIKDVLKKNCNFIGLDISKTVIDASKKIADCLDYRNMQFKVTDIRNYTADRDIHLAISLHACDTATDEAIALAVKNNAKAIVMVPCCQKEILNQYTFDRLKSITKYGVLKARLADVLTDGIRLMLLEAAGYKASVVEYVSPLETPKNLMIRAEKTGGVNKAAIEEYKSLKQELGIHPTLEKLILPYL
ncbi:methyltransferase family protein [Ruminiclostridium sufflavum DSM 19573]|uniref:Methyltransferase family protein n=1 Tax=Ruminiclostridium sufflavum DSM 19573 TaxID=1121337 RepID=A0A318Y0N9_9FIRM|nr:SAM-dependent methyltransferase [Ruminiclostridium sufflavum]PYG88864.1 methyltransferase family protein [Ruminiclostridium sufflavum DSM 19573]